MVELSKEDWNYLMTKADSDLKKVLLADVKKEKVELRIAPPYSYDDVIFYYTGIIQDSLDSDDEATDDTYHLEYIWDNFVMNIYSNQ